jgi:hypothetical protein
MHVRNNILWVKGGHRLWVRVGLSACETERAQCMRDKDVCDKGVVIVITNRVSTSPPTGREERCIRCDMIVYKKDPSRPLRRRCP